MGGVIGLERAYAFAAYGTEVTVVKLMPREQAPRRFFHQKLNAYGTCPIIGTPMLADWERTSGRWQGLVDFRRAAGAWPAC